MLWKHDRERNAHDIKERVETEACEVYRSFTDSMSCLVRKFPSEHYLTVLDCEMGLGIHHELRNPTRRFAPRFPEVLIFLVMMILSTTLYLLRTRLSGTSLQSRPLETMQSSFLALLNSAPSPNHS